MAERCAWRSVQRTARAAVDATTTRANTHGARKIAKIAALSPWEQAERGRDALERCLRATGRGRTTRGDGLVSAIYHANPADVHAPAR